ncbi:MAG: DoxX family membrane protein [Desulfobacterales bacterium]|nr:DoxX family membrane protein [Desulfobacterales bacterium]
MKNQSNIKPKGYQRFTKSPAFLVNGTYTWVRWILGVIFLYAGGSKLVDPRSFAVLIDAYGLVPPPLLMPVAVGLPALEVIAAAGLMADVRGSLAAMAGLTLLFVVILGYGVHMGLDVDCGCFGPEEIEAEAFHGLKTAIYRDLAMLAGMGYLYWWRFSRAYSPVRLRPLFKRKSMDKERS